MVAKSKTKPWPLDAFRKWRQPASQMFYARTKGWFLEARPAIRRRPTFSAKPLRGCHLVKQIAGKP
jgi:hypothetical protein